MLVATVPDWRAIAPEDVASRYLAGFAFLWGLDVVNIRNGFTLGQLLVGLRVVDARGQHLSFARAAIRNLVFWFGLLLFFATFFSIVFGHRSRGLHDRAAGAFVVRRRALDALHAAAGHAPPRGPGRLRALAGVAFLVALAFG